MRYISTRGKAPILRFSEANMGLAEDGGLYVPAEIRRILGGGIRSMATKSYQEIAIDVISPYIGDDDIPKQDLMRLIQQAYRASAWDDPQIAPVITLKSGARILELFHGPTLAFKDLAMQIVALIMQYDLLRKGRKVVIVVATSGDTGSAAIEAFRGMEGVDIFVLFPDTGTSPFQRSQMTTVVERNVYPIAITAPFDPCQAIVKELLAPDFKEECGTGGVNSIAWGRILAQIPYYFSAYSKVGTYGGERVTFVVPTGNMGDIYAGWQAMRMGLPINLVLATNSNRVLVDVFETGVYRPREKITTESPSMDIQQASNWERLLYYIVGRDPARVTNLMRELKQKGQFTLSEIEHAYLKNTGIRALVASEEECREAMQRVWNEDGYRADPHTAIGLAVGHKLNLTGRVVYLATASPVKFDGALRSAGIPVPERPARFVGIEERPEPQTVTLPPDPDRVKDYIRSIVNRP